MSADSSQSGGLPDRYDDPERLLSVRDISALLGMSQSYISRLMKRAGMPKGPGIEYPLRQWLALTPTARVRFEQRRADRQWLDTALAELVRRVARLEAQGASLRAEVRALRARDGFPGPDMQRTILEPTERTRMR